MKLVTSIALGVAVAGLAATVHAEGTTCGTACAATVPAAGAAPCVAPAATPAAAPAKAETKTSLWTDNFAAAKEQAAKEGKDILIDFTGSDWCGWCIKLKDEVFNKPEFAAAAPQKFVLVEADFPQQKQLPADVKAQNDQLQKEFGIEGFPTIYLLDSQGRPYAKTGYQPGGPGKYLESLANLQKLREARDAAWKKAAAAQGVAKAKLLAEGLATMDPEMIAGHYAAVIAELKKCDPQDTTGLVKKAEFQKNMAGLEKAAEAAYGDKENAAAAAKVIDDFIAANQPQGEDLQKVQFMKINLYPPSSAANIEAAIKLMIEVAAISPASATGKMAAAIQKQAEAAKARLAAEAAKVKADVAAPAPAAKLP